MTVRTPGFAAPLLAQARKDLDDELARHAAKVAELGAHIAALEATCGRTRRQVLADPASTPEAVATVLAHGSALTAAELRALLTRPHVPDLEHVVGRVFAAAVQDTFSSRTERVERRLLALTDAIVDVDAWPAKTRVRLVLSRHHLGVMRHLVERATAEPNVALLLGMHLDWRTWGPGGSSTPDWIGKRLRETTPHWAQIAAAMPVGHVDAHTENELRGRLAALAPVDVAARLASSLSPRTDRRIRAIRDRVEALEVMVAGVTAPAGVHLAS